MGYSFRLAARFLLYASSHRQDKSYHGLCYTSRGALAGTRNSSMGVVKRRCFVFRHNSQMTDKYCSPTYLVNSQWRPPNDLMTKCAESPTPVYTCHGTTELFLLSCYFVLLELICHFVLGDLRPQFRLELGPHAQSAALCTPVSRPPRT